MRILITGGIRSGKSRYALDRARSLFPDEPKCFIATAEPCDEEMKGRILRHQKERGNDFATLEAPLHLAEAVAQARQEFPVIVIDCLTFWINNLLFRLSGDPGQIDHQIQSLLKVITDNHEKTSLLMVTNEVGWGIVGDHPLNRNFADRLGAFNQAAGRLCEELILVVAGVPISIRGGIEIAELDL